jgi:anti-sigma factor ChrR (cupin superfamily)
MNPPEIKVRMAVYRECIEIIEASENRHDAAERIEWLLDVAAHQAKRAAATSHLSATQPASALAKNANSGLTDSTNPHTE